MSEDTFWSLPIAELSYHGIKTKHATEPAFNISTIEELLVKELSNTYIDKKRNRAIASGLGFVSQGRVLIDDPTGMIMAIELAKRRAQIGLIRLAGGAYMVSTTQTEIADKYYLSSTRQEKIEGIIKDASIIKLEFTVDIKTGDYSSAFVTMEVPLSNLDIKGDN